MFVINTRTITAIAIVEDLIRNEGSHTVAVISHRTGISDHTITAAVPGLIKSGILRTIRGVRGGVRLDNPSVTIWDVVAAVAPPIFDAPQSESWSALWAYFERAMKRSPLGEMVKK